MLTHGLLPVCNLLIASDSFTPPYHPTPRKSRKLFQSVNVKLRAADGTLVPTPGSSRYGSSQVDSESYISYHRHRRFFSGPAAACSRMSTPYVASHTLPLRLKRARVTDEAANAGTSSPSFCLPGTGRGMSGQSGSGAGLQPMAQVPHVSQALAVHPGDPVAGCFSTDNESCERLYYPSTSTAETNGYGSPVPHNEYNHHQIIYGTQLVPTGSSDPKFDSPSRLMSAIGLPSGVDTAVGGLRGGRPDPPGLHIANPPKLSPEDIDTLAAKSRKNVSSFGKRHESSIPIPDRSRVPVNQPNGYHHRIKSIAPLHEPKAKASHGTTKHAPTLQHTSTAPARPSKTATIPKLKQISQAPMLATAQRAAARELKKQKSMTAMKTSLQPPPNNEHARKIFLTKENISSISPELPSAIVKSCPRARMTPPVKRTKSDDTKSLRPTQSMDNMVPKTVDWPASPQTHLVRDNSQNHGCNESYDTIKEPISSARVHTNSCPSPTDFGTVYESSPTKLGSRSSSPQSAFTARRESNPHNQGNAMTFDGEPQSSDQICIESQARRQSKGSTSSMEDFNLSFSPVAVPSNPFVGAVPVATLNSIMLLTKTRTNSQNSKDPARFYSIAYAQDPASSATPVDTKSRGRSVNSDTMTTSTIDSWERSFPSSIHEVEPFPLLDTTEGWLKKTQHMASTAQQRRTSFEKIQRLYSRRTSTGPDRDETILSTPLFTTEKSVKPLNTQISGPVESLLLEGLNRPQIERARLPVDDGSSGERDPRSEVDKPLVGSTPDTGTSREHMSFGDYAWSNGFHEQKHNSDLRADAPVFFPKPQSMADRFYPKQLQFEPMEWQLNQMRLHGQRFNRDRPLETAISTRVDHRQVRESDGSQVGYDTSDDACEDVQPAPVSPNQAYGGQYRRPYYERPFKASSFRSRATAGMPESQYEYYDTPRQPLTTAPRSRSPKHRKSIKGGPRSFQRTGPEVDRHPLSPTQVPRSVYPDYGGAHFPTHGYMPVHRSYPPFLQPLMTPSLRGGAGEYGGARYRSDNATTYDEQRGAGDWDTITYQTVPGIVDGVEWSGGLCGMCIPGGRDGSENTR